MKISLQFINGAIVLAGVVSSATYRIGFRKIYFVVDTGSPKTFISEKDALAFQLALSALRFKEHIRLGGSKYEILSGKEVKLYFKTDDGKPVSFGFDLAVARTTKKSQEGIHESRSCPSIIGTDFLIKNDLGLYFYPSKSIYYLEKKD
jgi:hypothetical protein